MLDDIQNTAGTVGLSDTLIFTRKNQREVEQVDSQMENLGVGGDEVLKG